MSRGLTRLSCLAALAALLVCLGSGTAGAGQSKVVEGTVYDTTCGIACSPCPPPCGPLPAPQPKGDVVCAQARRLIACPLTKGAGAVAFDFCIQGQPCGTSYPPYAGEGAVVKVRRRGSAAVLATLPIVEGHFRIRLGPGTYVLRPILPEPECWQGARQEVLVEAKAQGPVPSTLWVSNSCVVHPDVK
jgi:hypothetical protein